MLALKITDQKNFTNKLFLGDTFDLFWLNQAEIITSNVFSIDGKLQTDFFDNDEQEFLASSHRTFSLWKEVKPFCYSVIRGKKMRLFLSKSCFSFLRTRPLHYCRVLHFHFLPN